MPEEGPRFKGGAPLPRFLQRSPRWVQIVWRELTRPDTHPVIQFFKYGVSGCIALATDLIVFYLLALTVLPALGQNDEVVRLFNLEVAELDKSTRTLHYAINKTISFIASNFVAYLLNRFFVFQSGRHRPSLEISWFYVISTLSWAAGTGLGSLLIGVLGVTTTVSRVADILAAVLINFAGRKFIVFKG